MQLKWKSQHFLGFPFLLSLVSVLGIKKFHISTSTSAIILKIQIKKYFLFFSIFSHFLGNQTVQQIQRNVISSLKLSWNFESETNRNSSEPKNEKNERILINFSILKLHKFKINKKKIQTQYGVWDIMWVETQIQKLYYCCCLCLVAFSTSTLKLDKSKKNGLHSSSLRCWRQGPRRRRFMGHNRLRRGLSFCLQIPQIPHYQIPQFPIPIPNLKPLTAIKAL